MSTLDYRLYIGKYVKHPKFGIGKVESIDTQTGKFKFSNENSKYNIEDCTLVNNQAIFKHIFTKLNYIETPMGEEDVQYEKSIKLEGCVLYITAENQDYNKLTLKCNQKISSDDFEFSMEKEISFEDNLDPYGIFSDFPLEKTIESFEKYCQKIYHLTKVI